MQHAAIERAARILLNDKVPILSDIFSPLEWLTNDSQSPPSTLVCSR
jgi:hypothetical protein